MSDDTDTPAWKRSMEARKSKHPTQAGPAEPAQPVEARAPQRKRTPFNGGAGRYRLHSPELVAHFAKQGFHFAWLNDTADQIYRAEQGGYRKVMRRELPGHLDIGSPDVGSGDTSLDSAVSRHVGTDKHGRAIHAFAMVIPREWFEEDEKVRQEPVDLSEQMLRRGQVASGPRAGQQVGNVYGDVQVTTGSD